MLVEQKYINLCRYLFLTGGVMGTLFKAPVNSYAPIIAASLVLIINSQVRLTFKKGKWTAVSIIAETIMVLLISRFFGGLMFLVLFTTMTDACFFYKHEIYLFAVYIGVSLLYILYRLYTVEWVITVMLFYTVLFLLLLQLKNELEMRSETESLYDRIRKYAYELEAAKARLTDYSKRVEKIAQLEERNRISRELHDSIGHSLTGILMQVDACLQIIQVDFERGFDMLNSVYGNINESIEVMRQTVSRLKPYEYRRGIAALSELAHKFADSTGVNVVLDTGGTPYELMPGLETILYRNVQEAMTNAVRHGHARNILINLIYKPDGVELAVSNDGLVPEVLNKGFGLSGIEERVGIAGGTVSYSLEKQFTVITLLPIGKN